jgi:hypothetical protein
MSYAATRWRANDFPSLFTQIPRRGGHSGMNPFAPRGGPRPRPRFNRRKCSMKSMLFMPSLVAGAVAPACSANPLFVGREIDGGRLVACASAGGTCVADASAGRDATTADARPGDRDGGSDGSAEACASAGGTCVQALPDAGSGRDGGAPDGAPSHVDGGNSDSGPDGGATACASAGGTCIGPTMACAVGAPVGAQDCTPRQGGTFCCLTP